MSKSFLALTVTSLCVGVLGVAGCGAGTYGALSAIGNAGSQIAEGAQAPQVKLMIFGGPDHMTYLGCLTCGRSAGDSVLNPYGAYGSPASAQSIWSHVGEFGSTVSNYSPCNPYASLPPVVVDQAGQFYGWLTVRAYQGEGRAPTLLRAWLVQKVCSQ